MPRRVPSIVAEELYVGVGAGTDAAGTARTYEALVENERIVPLDGKIARRAGSLEGRHLASDDVPDLGPADAAVAATGLVHDEAVVTSNRDFQSVDGLAVESF